MKNESQVTAALEKLLAKPTNYSGMTYEEGVEEALRWVLGEVEDTDFEYAQEED